MRILVTGGAGFIGSHLVDALIARKHHVAIVDNLSTGFRKNINSEASFYKLDIQSQRLEQVFKRFRPQVIFHLAAQTDINKSIANPIQDAKINIIGSLNVIECVRRFRVQKIIFSSSAAVYGKSIIFPTPETICPFPRTPYGIAKLMIERYLNYYQKTFGIQTVSLRYGNVYGPRQNPYGEAGVVAIFINKLLRGEQLFINGDGRQTRDFVYAGDVVQANLLALKKQASDAYNIGTDKETSVNELFKIIIELGKFKARRKHRPARPGEQLRSCLENQRARQVLGWSIGLSLRQGITQTIAWFTRENY